MKSEKMEQNKVLIVTDYLPDAKNSVSDILNVLIERLNNFGKKCVIIQYNNELAKMVVTKEYNFGKVYRGKPFKFISIKYLPTKSKKIDIFKLCAIFGLICIPFGGNLTSEIFFCFLFFESFTGSMIIFISKSFIVK